LRANFRELLHYVGGLKDLSLSGCFVDVFPTLPLAQLTRLNMSHNFLTSISPTAPRLLTKLQVLSLARNQLSTLQAEVWRRMPSLTSLDISHNPFTIFDRTNFVGLARLNHLTLSGVPFTDTFEGSPFSMLERLTSITLDTFPQV
jgi:Leucine-rich repeat (LRR) protein